MKKGDRCIVSFPEGTDYETGRLIPAHERHGTIIGPSYATIEEGEEWKGAKQVGWELSLDGDPPEMWHAVISEDVRPAK